MRDLRAEMPAEAPAGSSAMIGGLVPGHDLALVTSAMGRSDHWSPSSGADDIVAAVAGAVIAATGAGVAAVALAAVARAIVA